MYKYNPLHCLPSTTELPCSDDKPVDSELQILIPNLLLAILSTRKAKSRRLVFWYQYGNIL